MHCRPCPELPEDVAASELSGDIRLVPLHPVELPVARQAAIEQAAILLRSARRPLVMFGAASNRPRLAGQLTEFIRRTGMPFFNTQMGKGTVSAIGNEEASELWMGTAALSERDYLHEAIDRADLILAIGHDTIEKPPFIMGPDGPMVIHVGYTPANVEQVFFPHAEVVGDLGLSLALLADLVEGKLPHTAALAPLREGILMRTLERAEESRFPLTPQRIVHDVRKIMPADGIVALDNGMYKLWFARCYRTRSANTLLLDNALATMGAGLPSAMMAAILHPDRRVMAVCGDGGFMMNSQELETAVRLTLNLVVLIIQDDAYGMIRWKQAVDSFADWGLTFGNPDFVKYADAYGAKGRRIEAAEALAPALESAFREGGVQLVIVPVDYSENVRVFVEELGNRVTEVAQ
ncbi:thiamine pyrophosphate-dependent enzyme [Paraburkholderia panacisoli]|uniref:thiamine pyrophosphate-dependent enzyme n=1 Tax=Paraburkholderia panacisoli TaxID=2603818 RepID=UPI003CCC89A5